MEQHEDHAEHGEHGEHPLSRSERKRRAEALQKLGVQLTLLRPAQLQHLRLPAELLDAVIEAQRLRSRAALARQRQFIGRLMRNLEPEVVQRALAQVADSRDAKMAR